MKYMPPSNEPVAASILPTASDPMSPPVFPSVLMKPALPAAAVPVKKSEGRHQNEGRYAFVPRVARKKASR